MRINIALGVTNSWFKYSRITICSILSKASKKDDYYFYILSNNFNEEDKELFLRLRKIHPANFEFVLIDDSFFEGAIHDWLGVSSSYRLRIPSLINESKMLYLDSDIIALKNIKELYSIDVSDYYLAMVEDKCSDMMKNRVGLLSDEIFFNGGMQLMNLERFREENLEDIIMQKLRASSYYTDQDVINDVCKGNILSLPLKYNIMPFPAGYQTRKDEYNEAIEDPVLVHFTSKPWKGFVAEYTKEWHKYKDIVETL